MFPGYKRFQSSVSSVLELFLVQNFSLTGSNPNIVPVLLVVGDNYRTGTESQNISDQKRVKSHISSVLQYLREIDNISRQPWRRLSSFWIFFKWKKPMLSVEKHCENDSDISDRDGADNKHIIDTLKHLLYSGGLLE